MKISLILKVFSSVLLILFYTVAYNAQAQNNNSTIDTKSHSNSNKNLSPRYIADLSDSPDVSEDRQNNMDSALESHIDTEDIWDANGNNILAKDATSIDPNNIDLNVLLNKGQIVFKNGANLKYSSNTTLKVAVLLPLTGKNSRYGNDILLGIEKAVFKYNKPNLALQIYDTKSTVASTKTAYNQAKTFGAEVILGPLLARSTYEISDQARADGIPLISFTNNTIVAKKGVYVMGQLPEDSVSIAARYAFAKKRTKDLLPKFAVVAPTGAYGDILLQALEQTAKELHTKIIKTIRYNNNSNMNQVAYNMAKNPNAPKVTLKQTKTVKKDPVTGAILPNTEEEEVIQRPKSEYDILLVVGSKKYAQSLIVALPYYDLDLKQVQLIGTQRWYATWVQKENTLTGSIFAAPDYDRLQNFNSAFKFLYHHVPVSLAAIGYDAYGMLATISDNKNIDDINKYIANKNGYNGVNGVFKFGVDGKVKRSLAVYRVTNHTFKKVQKPVDILK